jgi:hypothetical protein
LDCNSPRRALDGIGGADTGWARHSCKIHLARPRTGVDWFYQTRSFSAVLFRRQASKSRKDPATGETKELFLSLGDNEKNAIRQKLLQCLAEERVPNVRNKIGDAVAEVARQYTDNSEWSKLDASTTLAFES